MAYVYERWGAKVGAMFTEMCIYVGIRKAEGVTSVYVFKD